MQVTVINRFNRDPVTIVLNKDEARILAKILADEVIGEAGGEGLVDGFNEGLAADDPFWGDAHLTIGEVGIFCATLLEALHTEPEAAARIREYVKYAKGEEGD